MHLFEVIRRAARRPTSPATKAETLGLGAADEATLSQLQPLTHEAAACCWAPALGRRAAAGSGHPDRDRGSGSITWPSDGGR